MNPPPPRPGLFGQALAVVAGTILLVLGFMFSVVLLAVFAVAALLFGAWFFWKTRHLRKAMREAGAAHGAAGEGDVIEGEAVIVDEYRAGDRPALPDDRRQP